MRSAYLLIAALIVGVPSARAGELTFGAARSVLTNLPCSSGDPCGGSGGVSTIDSVNKAKAVVDDLAQKRAALKVVVGLPFDSLEVRLSRASAFDALCCVVTPAPLSSSYQDPTVSIERRLIIDALQRAVDADIAQLRLMGIAAD